MPDYKTTKKDFSEFTKEAEYWINYFGLLDWEIDFVHEKMDGARARCYYNFEGRISTIKLNTALNDSPKKNEIKMCAFHEVCELLLGQLVAYAKLSGGEGMISEYAHEIIRRLENTIFKEKRG